MSLLLELVHNTSDVYVRYSRIHDDLFRISMRKVVDALFPGRGVDYAAHERELALLHSRLVEINSALLELPKEELAIRNGIEIRINLSEYINALVESICTLRQICLSKSQQASGENAAESGDTLSDFMVSYDDGVQFHKQIGADLTKLLSTY
jgi:hypothetical protein